MKKLSTVTRNENSETESINPKQERKLCQMKSMKKLTTRIKLYGQIDEFLEAEIQKLDVQDADNALYLNTVVLKEVMESAEKYFVYGSKVERNEMKRDAVLILLGKYFDDNEDVLNRFMEVMLKKVKKYGFIRRVLMRSYNGLFKKRKV